MIDFLLGCLIITALYLIDETIHQILHDKYIETILKPGEIILCKNATLLMDKHGSISFVNNAKKITLIKGDSK